MNNPHNCKQCSYYRKYSMKYRIYEPFCEKAFSTIRELISCPRVREIEKKQFKADVKDVESVLFPETETLDD
mgnify:CR=1 FL=1